MGTAARFVASARLIAALTLGSRVLGLIRESVFASFFSTSEVLSAFRIAFMVPNLARRLFGEGALSAATIPVLSETVEHRGQEAARRLSGALLTLLVAVLAVGVVAAELGIAAWDAIRPDPALKLTALLLPYMVLICTVAVVGGMLNVRGHFTVPSVAPMILNLAIIGAAVAGASCGGLSGMRLIRVVCWAILGAGALQVIASGVALRSVSFFPILSSRWRDPEIRSVAALMLPMVLGLSAVQINSLADYLIAYLFIREDGQRVGPAVLGYAQYLYQLPLGVFGIAVATALFPVLSRRAARGDRVGMAAALDRGVRLSFFIAMPASVGLLFVAKPLVAVIFEHGRFSSASTQRVAGTLFFYSLGIVAYFLNHLLARTFYALHDSRAPARVALCMVAVNLGLNLGLVFLLEERGLALATAVCATIQASWLSIQLARRMPEIPWPTMARGITKTLAATGVMAAALTMAASWSREAFRTDSPSVGRLAVLVITGIAVYGLAARFLRIEELGLLLGRDRSRLLSVRAD